MHHEFALNRNLIIKAKEIQEIDSIFFAATLFTLTKFIYNKHINISKLYLKDNVLKKKDFIIDINTEYEVKDFINKVQKQITEIEEENNLSSKSSQRENISFNTPDLQYYYKFEKENFKIPSADFTIIFREQKVQIIYNQDKYNERTIQIFHESLLIILKQFQNPNLLLKNISISKTSIESIGMDIESLNSSSDELLTDLFEKTVNENGDKIALVAVDRSLTYLQLNQEANRVANALIKKGLRVEDSIIIQLKRTSKLIVCMWGVIKAGGTVIFVDYNSPSDRVEFLKRDSNTKYLINDENIDFLLDEVDIGNPIVKLKPFNLAFIVYTSGSTGHPKGAMQTHKACSSKYKTIRFKHLKSDKFLAITTVIHISFLIEALSSTLNGLTIVLADEEETLNPIKLAKLSEKTNPKHITMTPSRLDNFIEYEEFCRILINIQTILTGGEKLNNTFLNKIRKITNSDLYFMYGSTEVNLPTNIKLITDENDINSIGIPFVDVLYIITDIDGNLLPSGVMGELWIGGSGIAKGYLNNAELNNEKFIKINNIPFFKTGDLVKKDEKNEYRIIGRIDNQIKFNGLRIEPAEIENNVPDNIGLKKTVVTIGKLGNEDVLVLYFVTNEELNENEISRLKKEIRSSLDKKLPNYMVPHLYINLKEFPLTRSCKIDIKKLSQLNINNIFLDEIITPSTTLEMEIYVLCVNILGYDNFGINNSLLSIGFTSLSIIKLLNKILKEYNVELKLGEIINIDIRELSKKIEQAPKINHTKNETRKYYPLTSQQFGVYYDSIINENTIMYNTYGLLKINNSNVSRVKKALEETIKSHNYLNTEFINIDGVIYQKPSTKKVNIPIINKIPTPEDKKVFIKPFKLHNELLYRFKLYYSKNQHNKTTDSVSVFLFFDFHHALIDGESINIFFNDFFKLYNNDEILSPEEFTSYDLAIDEEKYLNSKEYKSSKEFFKKELSSFDGELSLPSDKSNHNTNVSGEEKQDKISIDKNCVDDLAKELNITPNILFFSAVNLGISKFNNNSDSVLISTIFNQRDSKYYNSLGMMVKTIPLITNINNENKIKDFIKNINKKYWITLTHSGYPFMDIVKDNDLKSDILYTYQYDLFSRELDDNISIQSLSVDNIVKFKLEIEIQSIDDEYIIEIKYDDSFYSNYLIKSFLNFIKSILNEFRMNLNQPLKKLDFINSIERNLLVNGLNNVYVPYPRDKTIVDLFEEQVRKTPGNIAVVFEDVKLSYAELNERANKLANYLIVTYGVQPDDLVALLLDRSENMIVSILGVLKSGAAYVPISPEYPQERINYMVKDSGAKTMITDNLSLREVENDVWQSLLNNKVINIDILFTKNKNLNKFNPETSLKSSNLVYLIYTSGTTGKPKGVMVEHSNLIRLLQQIDNYYKFSKYDIWTMFHSYTFDFSVWEVFTPLLFGSKLIVPLYTVTQDMFEFYNLVQKEKVTILNQTPLAFEQFSKIAINNEENKQLSLRHIILGGDKLNLEIIDSWFNEFGEILPVLTNMYGITETTVHTTYQKLSIEDVKRHKGSLIGRPIENLTAYILSSNMQLLPKGAIGELYMGGEQVARGYHNNEKLTNEYFIPNPFQTIEQKQVNFNDRIYKTGDLVRYLENGDIEYIGRNDNQVKIRGFRIELGEIESRLLEIDGVKQVTVQALNDKNNNKFLAAYYVLDTLTEQQTTLKQKNAEIITQETFIEFLGKFLPDYMIPQSFTCLEQLPLTINGKLDVKALPNPEFDMSSEYLAPRTKIEEQVVEAFSQTLGISASDISIMDNFFYLGGDSIKAIQLVNKIRELSDVQVNVKLIFETKTPKILASNIENQQNKIKVIKEAGILNGRLALLPIQKEFFNKVNHEELVDYNHFNQSFMVLLKDVDEDLLNKALIVLFNYHDALRINYKKDVRKRIIQFYKKAKQINTNQKISFIKINRAKLNNKELNNELTELQSGLDIFDDKFYQIALIDGYKDGYQRLLFIFHHLIIDAVSWRLIADNLKTIYYYLKENSEIINLEDPVFPEKILGGKQTSYRNWTKLVNQLSKEVSFKEKEYWQKINKNIPDYNKILTNLSIKGKPNQKPNQKIIQFSKETTKVLLTKINDKYNTDINDILLTSLSLALKSVTGEDENFVSLETHGRNEFRDDVLLNKTVGWFTAKYPQILISNKDIIKALVNQKDEIRKISNNGIAYGSLYGYSDLPKIVFNYLGQFDSNQEITLWNLTNDIQGNTISNRNIQTDLLSINGAITENKLSFSISSLLNDANLEKFSETFKKTLEDIVNQLVSMSRTYLTLSDVDNVVSQDRLEILQENSQLEAIYKTNPLQTEFIYQNLTKNVHDDAYIVDIIGEYNKYIDHQKFKKALLLAVEAFPSLRACFSWQKDLIQIIYKNLEDINYTYHDITDKNTVKQDEYMNMLLDEDRGTSYDLSIPGLFRFHLIKTENKHYKFIFSNHHIILDGWSNTVLFSFINKTYQKLMDNQTVVINEDIAYLNAQKYYPKNKDKTHEYWMNKINTISENYSFEDLKPFIKDGNKFVDLNNYNYVKIPEEEKLIITGDLFKKIDTFSKKNFITLSSITLYTFHKILKTNNQDSNITIVGVTLFGRTINVDDIDKSVGLYINTLPIIKVHNDSSNVVDEIKNIQNSVNEANNNFNQNLREINKIKGNKLFNSLFVYENYPVEDYVDFSVVEVVDKWDYPMRIVVFDNSEDLVIIIQYDADLFDNSIIKNILNTMENTLEIIVNNNKLKSGNIHCCQNKKISF
jgi:amino acid adenylation domain-containing protein/non-ribosomal peptide synthase protein (TIGR01720 family)